MTKFFKGGLSDSDTSSSDEELYSEAEESEAEEGSSSESGSEDESEEAEESGDDEGGSRFLKGGRGGSDDGSDEDEGKRVVKSAKDKRLEEIEASIKLIENGQKINDWVVISAGAYTDSQNLQYQCGGGVVWWGNYRDKMTLISMIQNSTNSTSSSRRGPRIPSRRRFTSGLSRTWRIS